MASRSSRRGAWVAPANEPLRDVVQLDPPLGADWLQALQDAQVNVVRHEPGGFLWLAADTLSDDDDLRPIGVRRLLQTLRRAALLHGAAYAFEPNSDAFRRTVQRGFEKLLSRAFELGAFAGATADAAYQVNTGSPPNTPETVDDGRLIVELQVAPSRPLTFLTVRLVRTGEGSSRWRRADVEHRARAVPGIRSPRSTSRSRSPSTAAHRSATPRSAECDGLEMNQEVKTIREGGNNGVQIRLAGATTYGTLTLKRGMTASFDLWDWFEQSIADPSVRADAEVVLLAPDDTERVRFVLHGCLPVKLKAPPLNAKDGMVAVEELQVAYESLKLQNPGGGSA